ncbi:hypothetical protein GGU10DRAFT_355682 [Lentinula aff. detonsa]|uniref:Uncharacterized protein n=1 Tax=Lentinula aff. detonsa TaxID=2804958 RepID=A0AA38KED5_9AGAR|nr:hypothetical protein GGU10DRAFT_355682 [Lentinula aff. detonsa]
MLEADSRSTICFPDDGDVELGPYRKSFSGRDSSDVPLSPCSSTSTYALSPATPTSAPPSYTDVAPANTPASPLSEIGRNLHPLSSAPSVMTLDSVTEMAGVSSQRSSLSLFMNSNREQNDGECRQEEDEIFISDAFVDSRPTSPVHPLRVPTPIPFISSDLLASPPPVPDLYRPFSLPSVYPIVQPHSAREVQANVGMIVAVQTQSSREALV